MRRESMSVPPPGGNGTMNRMGRVGYDAAVDAFSAAVAWRYINATSSAASTRRILISGPRCLKIGEARNLSRYVIRGRDGLKWRFNRAPRALRMFRYLQSRLRGTATVGPGAPPQ